MGLIFVFLLLKQLSYLNAFLLGLIFFISSQTYPSALLLESLWLILILTTKLLKIVWYNHSFKVTIFSFLKWKNVAFAIAFLIPILLSVPYFYSIYTHNIANFQFAESNHAANSFEESVMGHISFNWLLDIPSLSAIFSELGRIFSLASFTIILCIAFLIPKLGKKLRNVFPKGFAFSLFLVYFFWIAIMAYLSVALFLPIKFLNDFFNPERVWQHIFIAVTIMSTIVIFSFLHLYFLVLRRLLKNGARSVKMKFNKNRLFALAISVLLISTLLFLSVPVVEEQQQTYNRMKIYLNYYTVLGHDDIALLNWIKDNVSSQALILISRGDSGQYLTAITKKQSFCGYNGIENYTSIMTFLTANSSDLRAIPYLIDNKISFVYVGSKPSSFALDSVIRRPFNASQFLATPYFNLIKEVGNAWLFEFDVATALKVYTSDARAH